jgi:hypothetical protein
MRNFLVLLTVSIISITSGISQQVDNKNWTLVHEKTADWCSFCGSWGWQMKNQIFDEFSEDNLIFMAVHYSGGLTNPTAAELSQNFSGAGQPIFYMDGTDLGANSGNINEKIDDIELVVEFKNTLPAFAGVGINANLSQETDVLTVDAKVEFFNDVEGGDYFLGLYLLEDVMNTQAGRTGLQLHKNVLRRSLLNTTFGNPLQKGAVTKGTIFNVSANIPNITSERNKLKVVGIIWNKVNNKYLFFNANQVNVGIPASADSETGLSNSEPNIYQSENGTIHIDTDGKLRLGLISISDISGKPVYTEKLNHSENGLANQYKVQIPNFTSGIYLVSCVDVSGRTMTKKIYLY